ncbi:MAG: nucleoside deaminase [Bacteroidetes bacterium]|nr:nucleoside deaminase [Bacteroidota bacterium]
MNHEHFMQLALREAEQAFSEDEVPIGAVVVMNERVIARGHNMTEKLGDPTAHAELIALTAAFNALGSKYLPEATLYVTIEPCAMCAGALYWSQIGQVVFGAPDDKSSYRRNQPGRSPFHPRTVLIGGILADDCVQLMKDFFKNKRT